MLQHVLLCSGHLLECGASPDPWSSLPGLEEAVGCCEDPLWADEGAPADVRHASFQGSLDADDPGPGPWLGIFDTHDA